MIISLKKTLHSNIFLKIVSILIGYFSWAYLSNNFQSSITLTLPLSFYNKTEKITIDAPEQIDIELKGKKNILKSIDTKSLCIIIDAQELKEGQQLYTIDQRNIFLPSEIIINNYKPYNLIITKKTYE